MKTNKTHFKLIWFGFPVTKLVYAYLAYSNQKEINNSFQMLSLAFLLIGLTTSCVSMLLSKKIYKKSFYENKIVTSFLSRQATSNEDASMSALFSLFAMLLGLAESAALFGFVQYIMTGNLIVAGILFAFCFIAWIFNYPSNQDSEEE